MRRDPIANHPLGRVHRAGAAVLGTALVAFGCVGFARGLPFLSLQRASLMGMGSNGLLATISVVVGVVLVGMALLFTGAYGRISGGLAADNPYARDQAGHPVPDPERSRSRLAEIDEMSVAENAVSNGVATPAQSALVRADRLERARAHHRRAHERAGQP